MIALVAHGIILSADISWLRGFSPNHVPAKSITISLLASRQNSIPKQALQNIAKPPQDRVLPLPQKKIDKIAAARQPVQNAIEKKRTPIPVLPKSSLKTQTKSKPKKNAKKPPRSSSEARSNKMPLSAPELSHGSGNQTGRQRHNFTKALSTPDAPGQTAADDKQSFSAAIQIARPIYKKNPSPKYPRRARKLGYEGVVILDVQVDENGVVNDLKILESSGHEILDNAAVSSVKRWQFEPGTSNGKKVKMWVKVPIRFQLN